MKNVRIEAMIPAKEVSEFISLVESVEGKVLDLSLEENGRKVSSKTRKRPVRLTHQLAAQILDLSKKHPEWPQAKIGEQLGVSYASVGRVLSGSASILKKKRKKKKISVKKVGAK